MHEELPIEKQLELLELTLLEAGVLQSERVAELLAEDFVEFGSSGRVFNKEQILASMRAASPATVTASQVSIKLLSANIALVTYRAYRQTEPSFHTLRSSIWEQTGDRWQMIFHQGTLATPSQ